MSVSQSITRCPVKDKTLHDGKVVANTGKRLREEVNTDELEPIPKKKKTQKYPKHEFVTLKLLDRICWNVWRINHSKLLKKILELQTQRWELVNPNLVPLLLEKDIDIQVNIDIQMRRERRMEYFHIDPTGSDRTGFSEYLNEGWTIHYTNERFGVTLQRPIPLEGEHSTEIVVGTRCDLPSCSQCNKKK